jgi:hypothetical protein
MGLVSAQEPACSRVFPGFRHPSHAGPSFSVGSCHPGSVARKRADERYERALKQPCRRNANGAFDHWTAALPKRSILNVFIGTAERQTERTSLMRLMNVMPLP